MSTATERKCSITEYHSDSANSISHSELDVFIESPSLYRGRFITGIYPRETTKALDLGTVFHDLVLGEPFLINETNYSHRTVAIFKKSHLLDSRKPNFISNHGSRYWFSDLGILRFSAHWGEVGGCFWHFDGTPNPEGDYGFCPLSHFVFNEAFVPIPSRVLSKSGSRAGGAWDDFEAEHEGRILLKPNEFSILMPMLQSAQQHPKAGAILTAEGRHEHSIWWTDPETGLQCRCRLDISREFLIGDLKSCASSKPKAFANAVETYGYHRQAAWYQDGWFHMTGEALPFCFIAVEKCPPFSTRVFTLRQEWIDRGRDENTRAMRELLACRESGRWEESGSDVVQELSEPGWAKFESAWEMTDGDN